MKNAVADGKTRYLKRDLIIYYYSIMNKKIFCNMKISWEILIKNYTYNHVGVTDSFYFVDVKIF